MPDEGPRAIMHDHKRRKEFPAKNYGVPTSCPTVNFAGSKRAAPRPAKKTQPAPPNPSPEGTTYESPGRKSGVSSIKKEPSPVGTE